MKDINYYIKAFRKLRRDRKNGGAPHKPVLLLSIIEAIDRGYITSPRIEVIPELVLLFKDIWSVLVVTKHDPRFPLPYYHMRSEPFWKLIPKPGCEIWVESKSAMRSFRNLYTAVEYALIDSELFAILSFKQHRQELTAVLLQQYFPHASELSSPSINHSLAQLQNSILMEDSSTYISKAHTLSNDEFEETTVLRSGIFKREIPKLYSHTCAISKLQVAVAENISMIDACHIIPFSESKNDSVTNGFALCPNLHRAFDRGLIAIDGDYRVKLSPYFTENSDTAYSIKQFEGEQLLLPSNEKYLPSLEGFQWHYENRFLK